MGKQVNCGEPRIEGNKWIVIKKGLYNETWNCMKNKGIVGNKGIATNKIIEGKQGNCGETR